MIARFAQWLKPGGILEFTSGDSKFETLHLLPEFRIVGESSKIEQSVAEFPEH